MVEGSEASVQNRSHDRFIRTRMHRIKETAHGAKHKLANYKNIYFYLHLLRRSYVFVTSGKNIVGGLNFVRAGTPRSNVFLFATHIRFLRETNTYKFVKKRGSQYAFQTIH